jgi:PAS domain S-box-containing protein
MKSPEIHPEEQEALFYQSIVENLPGNILVNVVNDVNDKQSFVNLWTNKRGLDFIGYSQKEISEIGFEFFLRVVHPDDIQVLMQTISRIQTDPKKSFGGLIRVRSKEGDYHWMMWSVTVMEFKNGVPWKMLIANLDVSEMVDSENQISILLKENLRLKNQLRTCLLTRRETEILKLISQGMTDKEIGECLHISAKTVKTHRNNLHRKLHQKNTASLVHFAFETGLV